ncbi:unnamed protein product [Caenorhabditis auriculariae]|uniref:Uncharacterized protein n=1 Tax=Caenorhabditis auriculariae TaxID=2777116 RepID=A0A8S1HQ26_9PELO|nr:unnamed protein product [Caenorhabditis auriculariae]
MHRGQVSLAKPATSADVIRPHGSGPLLPGAAYLFDGYIGSKKGAADSRRFSRRASAAVPRQSIEKNINQREPRRVGCISLEDYIICKINVNFRGLAPNNPLPKQHTISIGYWSESASVA